MVLRECAICQSSIYPTEETTACPACQLVYHTECWQQNFGCASYGCTQVNALAPKPAEPEPEPALLPPPDDGTGETLPWSFLLLGAATISLLLSALTYGLPSLLTAVAIGWRLHKRRDWSDRVLIGAAALAVVGVVAGIILSRFWWRAYVHEPG
jgi:hypothetical protein